jgi:RNA recognition motif-containing protein
MVKVTNVPYDLSWQDVKDAFKSAGHVDRVELEKGVAWVKFSDARDAASAVTTYDGGEMNGRTIKVTLA